MNLVSWKQEASFISFEFKKLFFFSKNCLNSLNVCYNDIIGKVGESNESRYK